MSSGDADSAPILIFRLGDQLYGLPIADVVEAAAVVALTKVPDVRPEVLGIANRHGEAIPVLDLRLVLGHPAAPITITSLFIVVQVGGQLAGLLVDEVHKVQYVVPDQISTAPTSGKYVGRIISDEMGLVQVIAVDLLLTAYLTEVMDFKT